jgi:hypothetical protein
MAPNICNIRDQNTKAILAKLDELIAAVSGGSSLAVENFQATGDGSTLIFPTAHDRAPNTLASVRVGGVPQAEGSDYTFIGGQIVFGVAPANGEVIDADFYYAV